MKKYRLIRGSEVDEFIRCRKRWKWRWIDKLAPKKIDGKIFFGNLFHTFIQEYNNYSFDFNKAYNKVLKMFEETDTSNMEQVELDELWDTFDKVSQNYVRQWHKYDLNNTILDTEFLFAIPLADGIAYTGSIDVLYLDGEGRLWFKDYKTTNSIEKYEKRAEMDQQIRRYFWALQQLAKGNGYVFDKSLKDWVKAELYFLERYGMPLPEPHGFIYDLVARKAPKEPQVLKNGSLSKNKSQDTTYDMYLQAIIKYGLNTEDYQDMLEHLKAQETAQGNRFFRRINVHCHQEEIENAIQEFYAKAFEMMNIVHALEDGSYYDMPYDPIYCNINDNCSWDCPVKSLCLATMDGTYVESMVDLFYDRLNEEDLGEEYLTVEG